METISTNQANQGSDMSSVPVLAGVTRGIVRREKYRVGDATVARQATARRLRIGLGTLKNLVYERIKTVSSELRDRIVAAAIADLSNEINKLEYEKQLLVQMGTSPDHNDMRALEGALATARQAIERMR